MSGAEFHVRRIAWLMASAVLALPLAAYGQSPEAITGTAPVFEAATMKQSAKDEPTALGPWHTDGFTVRNASLELLIEIAFGVQHYQIAGEPSWVDSQRFDVNARTEAGRIIDWKNVQLPLQKLLQDRLHLQVHREQKEVSGYALVIGKTGPKLTPTKAPLNPGYVSKDRLQCTGMPLNGLASMLAMATHRPVSNQTRIEGAYDVDLRFAPVSDPGSGLPDLFTAIQEQLGLKLEPAKVPVEMLVIDHAERLPTED